MGTRLLQRYSPDTCGCTFVQEFPDRDDTSNWRIPLQAVTDRDGNAVISVVRCEAHQGLSEDEIARCIVKDADSEQKRKNGLIRELMEDLSIGLAEDRDSTDHVEMEDHPQLGRVPRLVNGQAVALKERRLKPGVDIRHVFTGTGKNRSLEMWVVGATVTPAMRAKLNACAARCGSPERPVAVRAVSET